METNVSEHEFAFYQWNTAYTMTELGDFFNELYTSSCIFLIIYCVGSAISVISLAVPISTWWLFRKTRNFQNYTKLHQCITATVVCLLTCASMACTYYFNNIEEFGYNRGYISDEETETLSNNSMFIQWLATFCGYMMLSTFCWNAAVALLYLDSAFKVFGRGDRWKYLIVSLTCYGLPTPLFLSQQFYDSVYMFGMMNLLAVTATSLSVCVYLCVAFAIISGKQMRRGETVKTITAAILIFIVFGFSVSFMYSQYYYRRIFFEKTLEAYYIRMKYERPSALLVDGIYCVLVSATPVVLTVFYTIGTNDIRLSWVKLFTKNSGNSQDIEL